MPLGIDSGGTFTDFVLLGGAADDYGNLMLRREAEPVTRPTRP